MKTINRSRGLNLCRLTLLFLLATCLVAEVSYTRSEVGHAQQIPAYKNASLPIDERVKDLLSRMTIEEKAAQMMCLWDTKPNEAPGIPKGQKAASGDFSPDLAKQRMPYGIGQIARQQEARDPKSAAEYANTVQKWLIENTRLGIPAVFHDEILHGNMEPGSTVFPVPLSLASSWD